MAFQVPRYWARAEKEVTTRSRGTMHLVKYGWSDSNASEAQRQAERWLETLVSRVMSGEALDHYSYGERGPLREELIQEVRFNGETVGYVTRNRYGSLVLNAARAMFVDIDLPQPKKSSRGLLARLFGKAKTELPPDVFDEAIDRIAAWARQHSDLSARLYRTNAGLRLVITSEPFEPQSPATRRIFDELGADPLYQKLCQHQECFRARLTPKPWRMGLRVVPHEWPIVTPRREAQLAKWQQKYEALRPKFAVCELVRTFGRGEVAAEIAPILALHDEIARVGSGLPLA